MSEHVLYADAVKELSFSELMDMLYIAAEKSQAINLTVQYASTIEETCRWSIDLLDDRDIHDAALFIKAFELTEGYSHLHSISFRPYDNTPFYGDAKNWKMGGDHWRADSREKEGSDS